MMNKFYFCFILAFTLDIVAQETEFRIREIIKQMDYEYELMTENDFEQVISICHEKTKQEHTPKSENDFLDEYPHIFHPINSCYHFEVVNHPNQKICCFDTIVDYKGDVHYKFKGVYCDRALIYIEGYEYWGYLTVDLVNGSTFYTMGYPQTVDCQMILSHDNYYLEEEIALTNMQTKKQLVLGVEGWTTKETKQTSNKFYLKLEDLSCPYEFKYMVIYLLY